MNCIITVLCLLCSALCLPAAELTDAWSVDIRQHTAVDRTYKQGESRDMQITLRNGTLPLDLTGATARFYWYTNATVNLWWTNAAAVRTPRSGIVTAAWTPAMDVGAAAYPYWIGLWLPGSTCPVWRVNGTIRLLSSPGFIPNAQVPPVRTLDFSAITVTNAPWVQASDWQSGSNALSGALQALSTNLSAQLSVITGELARAAALIESNRTAIAAIPPPSTDAWRLVTPDGNEWRDATGGVWRITYALETNVICTFSSPFGVLYAPDMFAAPENAPYVSAFGSQIVDNTWIIRFNPNNDGVWEIVSTDFYESWTGYGTTLPVTTTVTSDFIYSCFGSATFDYHFTPYGPPITSRVDTVALRSDLAALTNGLVSADAKELHADSYTNLLWRTVWSNGWCWAVAYTNTP